MRLWHTCLVALAARMGFFQQPLCPGKGFSCISPTVPPLQVNPSIKPKFKQRKTHSLKSVILERWSFSIKMSPCVFPHSSVVHVLPFPQWFYFQRPKPWEPPVPDISFKRLARGSSLHVGGTQDVMKCWSLPLSSESLHGHSPFSRKGDLSVLHIYV